MTDIQMLLAALAFAVLTWLLVVLSDALMGGKS